VGRRLSRIIRYVTGVPNPTPEAHRNYRARTSRALRLIDRLRYQPASCCAERMTQEIAATLYQTAELKMSLPEGRLPHNPFSGGLLRPIAESGGRMVHLMTAAMMDS
jgi:hypothetical protein